MQFFNRRNTSIIVLLLDFLLLNATFMAMHLWETGTLVLTPAFANLLVACWGIWIVVSLSTRKFILVTQRSIKESFFALTRTALYMLYFVSFAVVIGGFSTLSRFFIFGTFIAFYLTEIIIVSLFYLLSGNFRAHIIASATKTPPKKHSLSAVLLIADFLVFTSAFFLMNYLKRGTLTLSTDYQILLLIMYGVWFLTSFVTHKFDNRNFRNIYFAIAPFMKSMVLMVIVTSFLIVSFRLFYYSRLHIFGSFVLLMIGETIIYCVYYIYRMNGNHRQDIESIDEVQAFLGQEELPLSEACDGELTHPVDPITPLLQQEYLKEYPWVFEFISRYLDIDKFDKRHSKVMNTHEIFNVSTIDNQSLRLFVNLHRLNDVRWMNRYFLEIYKKLANGGFMVIKAHTIATHKQHFFKKYPKYFRAVFYVLHFIVHRIFPKTPGIKKVYFAVTKGKNRMISRAQVLGRLHFCGFKVIAEDEHNDTLFVIVQKVKTPSLNENPSYGPLVKFERVGLGGQIISTYKFRTMHPYSEYLQEYVYEKNKLQAGGKFNNDFRISTVGKFMRKTFIDEIPMFYNWMKGDLMLVGVRPISSHYLSLYSPDLRDLRAKVKPGLIPPFYADLPETFDEICESERRYIESFLTSPVRTQCTYLGKALYNVIVRGARSN